MVGNGGLSWLSWGKDVAQKYDIRDLVSARVSKNAGARKTVAWVESRMTTVAPEGGSVVGATNGSASGPVAPLDDQGTHKRMPMGSSSGCSIEVVLKTFRKHLAMTTDLEDAVRIMLAVALSARTLGTPLWMFVVGPPASGKTMLLSSLMKSQDVFFQSSVHAKALVSGFKAANGADPSIVPQMFGKCVVFKDFTEILRSHPLEQESVFSLFRGLYDGSLERSFGNGQTRKYSGWFSMLAGVTEVIHAKNYSIVGERFMKFILKKPSDAQLDVIMDTAGNSVGENSELNLEVQDVVQRFLDRPLPSLNTEKWVPEEYRTRFKNLAVLITQIRHAVERDREGDLLYQPKADAGVRLYLQLLKLSTCLALAYGLESVDEAVYELIVRVAFDTGEGFHLDVVRTMMNMNS